MSRIGKQPISIPKGVNVALQGPKVFFEGPKGKLALDLAPYLEGKVAEGVLTFQIKDATALNARAVYGLTRSLAANMVKGVAQGFTRELEINGVGFKAAVKGQDLELSLGFSHPVMYRIPQGVTVTVEKNTKLSVSGADARLVGQTAAEIRKYRKPEPYKGKGIKYAGETIRRKAGKAAAGAGTTS